MKYERDSQWNEGRTKLSRRSVVTFFVIGAIFISAPVVLVISSPSGSSCASAFMREICQGSRFYWASVNFFPYLMLIGGLIAGYNMKRVADSESYEENSDEIC